VRFWDSSAHVPFCLDLPPATGGVFVTFDDRLRTAAEREGFVTP